MESIVTKLSPAVVLTADDLSDGKNLELLSKYIQVNCIRFEVKAEGGGDITKGVPLKEQCRVLCDIEDFDLLYPFTLKCIAGKRLKVIVKMAKGDVVIGDGYVPEDADNLATVLTCFAKWPILMNWLCDFVGNYMAKKLPPLDIGALKAAAKTAKSQAPRS